MIILLLAFIFQCHLLFILIFSLLIIMNAMHWRQQPISILFLLKCFKKPYHWIEIHTKTNGRNFMSWKEINREREKKKYCMEMTSMWYLLIYISLKYLCFSFLDFVFKFVLFSFEIRCEMEKSIKCHLWMQWQAKIFYTHQCV